jgi:mannose-1-phosphate guanylyltransferase
MRAMVLCAGLGTRLQPLTEAWPKPAIPLLGAPLLRRSLEALHAAGIREVGINTFHLPELMERTAKDECARLDQSLTVSRETGEVQGTGGGIRGLQSFLTGDEFVVMAGDVLFELELLPIIAAHRASKAAATMVLLPMPEGAKFNLVDVDGEGHVRRIAGKGPGGDRLTGWHFSGVHVMTPAVFDFMRAQGPEDINHDVYLRMIEKGLTVNGHVLRERVYWSDLGTLQSYVATHRDLLFRHGPGYTADPTAQIGDVKVSGPAWFGPGCVLGKGVRIGSAVSVGPRANVGDGTSLNRTIVFEDVDIGPNLLIEDAMLFRHPTRGVVELDTR